ncbi:MAG: hypothetical protein NC453_24425 [Muribaculum sp.]|nr:hypothetical protein [Muribaculum sp.]
MKKFKLIPLNADEMSSIRGGETEPMGTCNKAGDTIYCHFGVDVKVCIHLEASCPSNFSSNCGYFKVTIACPSGFSIAKP